MPLSTERFLICHNLVTNKFPKGISLQELGTNPKIKPQVDLEKFGLFDISAPDFSTFYPTVSAEDLLPKDDDFVYPLFRALSEVIVNKYGPIDFSKAGVLKASMKKLVGQAVFPNHESNVGNELGVVVDVEWQEATKQKGVNVPAGFNARLKLDGKSNPKTIRGVMMDPPSVHSTSVGMTFEWEKSHPNMSDEDFWTKLGTIDAKELVRRVVTRVVAYHELSFVSHGADPYAQKVNDETGDINNPKYAKSRIVFKEEDYKAMTHFLDWKDVATFSMSSNFQEENEDSAIPKNQKEETYRFDFGNSNEKHMKKELLDFLATNLKMAAGSTEEAIITKLQERLPVLLSGEALGFKVQSDELVALKAKYPEGSVILSAEDKVKLAAYPTLDAQMTTITKLTREETTKFYNLVSGGADKADAGIIKLISEAPYESLTALHTQYKKQADEKFSATCQDCGSENVKRNSALGAAPGTQTHENGEGGAAGGKKVKSASEVSAELSAKAMTKSVAQIHGEAPKKETAK